jgi:hypothetical protein
MKSFWNNLRRILPNIVGTFTGEARYIPEVKWSETSWIYNVFRAYEQLFGRRDGVRPEGYAHPLEIDGNGVARKVYVECYTLENLLAVAENTIRQFLKSPFKVVNNVRIEVRQFAWGINTPELLIPWISFAIAFDTETSGGNSASTSVTFAATVTGSNPLIFGGMVASTAGDRYSSITYAGTTLTKIAAIQPDSDRWTSLSLLANCATGTNNMVASITTGSDNFVIPSALSYSGCATSGQPDNSHTFNVSPGTSVADTLSSNLDNCWHVAIVNEESGIPTVGANTTLRGSANFSSIFADGNGVVHPAGSSTLNFNSAGGASHYVAGIGVTIAPFSPSKTLTESASITDTLTRSLVRTESETLTMSDVLTAVRLKFQTLLESLALADTIAKMTQRAVTESIAISDSISKAVARALAEVSALTDAVAKTIKRTLSEAASILDVVKKYINGFRNIYSDKYSKQNTSYSDKYNKLQ